MALDMAHRLRFGQFSDSPVLITVRANYDQIRHDVASRGSIPIHIGARAHSSCDSLSGHANCAQPFARSVINVIVNDLNIEAKSYGLTLLRYHASVFSLISRW